MPPEQNFQHLSVGAVFGNENLKQLEEKCTSRSKPYQYFIYLLYLAPPGL